MANIRAGAAGAFRRGPPTVRSRLLLMAVSLVAPAAVFMFLLVQGEYQESRERYEAQLVATTRALALATDRQLDEGHATLRGLAVSTALETGDVAAFDAQVLQLLGGDEVAAGVGVDDALQCVEQGLFGGCGHDAGRGK